MISKDMELEGTEWGHNSIRGINLFPSVPGNLGVMKFRNQSITLGKEDTDL